LSRSSLQYGDAFINALLFDRDSVRLTGPPGTAYSKAKHITWHLSLTLAHHEISSIAKKINSHGHRKCRLLTCFAPGINHSVFFHG
jgi:hypothetical protein